MKELQITPAALVAASKGDLSNALVAATPGGIERQEAEGQRQMANSFRTLPKGIDREAAEAFGFVFGEDADEIFVTVTAPEGWAISPTDHAMHSDIVDGQGRKRGSIFYKAAFYDRRADGSWLPRYGAEAEYTEDYDVIAFKAVDRANGAVLLTEAVRTGEESRYARQDAAENVVLSWLVERFPNYRDMAAYWDDAAQAMSAGTAETEGLGAKPASAVPDRDAP